MPTGRTSVYAGELTVCLRSKNLDASKRFYEALGMSVREEVPGIRIVLTRGRTRLALMSFLEEDVLNFRGQDAFAIERHVAAAGLSGGGTPERYVAEERDADADGAGWNTRDPDGHSVLFDTNALELGPEAEATRLSRALSEALRELEDAGASEACLAAYREHVLEPFLPEPR